MVFCDRIVAGVYTPATVKSKKPVMNEPVAEAVAEETSPETQEVAEKVTKRRRKKDAD